MQNGKRLRVAQMATGNVGSRSLRRIIEHPGLELVGVHVYSDDKVGIDAGELAGLKPIGVKAGNVIQQLIDLRPDCVVYMPYKTDLEEVLELLKAGINVVTTRPEFFNPSYMEPQARARVEGACRVGASSIHSTGSSPGFSTEALPLTLASLQRRLDHIEIHEYADVSSRASAELVLDGMGFGKIPGERNLARLEHLRDSFGPSLALTAQTLGLVVDDLQVEGSLAIARTDTSIAAGVVKAGTVAAQRNRVIGLNQGKPIISFSATWYVSQDVVPIDGDEWFFGATGWRILMHGDTPLDVSIGFPVSLEAYADFTPNLTAHRPINAIPFVCNARPGIVTTADLPQIIAQL